MGEVGRVLCQPLLGATLKRVVGGVYVGVVLLGDDVVQDGLEDLLLQFNEIVTGHIETHRLESTEGVIMDCVDKVVVKKHQHILR